MGAIGLTEEATHPRGGMSGLEGQNSSLNYMAGMEDSIPHLFAALVWALETDAKTMVQHLFPSQMSSI